MHYATGGGREAAYFSSPNFDESQPCTPERIWNAIHAARRNRP